MKDTQNCVQTVADTQDLTYDELVDALIWKTCEAEMWEASYQRVNDENARLRQELTALRNRHRRSKKREFGGLSDLLQEYSSRVGGNENIILFEDGRRAA